MTTLKEENEKLKTQLNGFREAAKNYQKATDFLFVIFMGAVYFGALHFIFRFSRWGLAYELNNVYTTTSASILVAIYLTSYIVLYGIGIMVALWEFVGIFESDITVFVHRLFGILGRSFTTASKELEPEAHDDMDVDWEKKIGTPDKPVLKSKQQRIPKGQPNAGRFVKKQG